jgi:hypothetical protein
MWVAFELLHETDVAGKLGRDDEQQSLKSS